MDLHNDSAKSNKFQSSNRLSGVPVSTQWPSKQNQSSFPSVDKDEKPSFQQPSYSSIETIHKRLNPEGAIRTGSALHSLHHFEQDEPTKKKLDGWASLPVDISARSGSVDLSTYLSQQSKETRFSSQKNATQNLIDRALQGNFDTSTKMGMPFDQSAMNQRPEGGQSPKISASFYESHSKYIPLRKVRAENQDLKTQQPYRINLHCQDNHKTDSAFMFSRYSCVTQASQEQKTRLNVLKNWFKSLTLAEKSVAVTTVDKDLVNLFKVMHAKYSQNGNKGRFTANTSAYSENDVERLETIHPYQLLLIKPKYEPGLGSSHLRKKSEAEDVLVEAVRVVSVAQENDAITLDTDLIENSEFFMNIMKTVDEQFLMRQKDFVKVTLPLEGSLLVKTVDNGSLTRSKLQQNQRQYYLFKDNQRQTYPASSSASGSHAYERFFTADQEQDRSLQVSLAKCLLDVIEKGLNVHFNDFMGNIKQQQQFFFLKDQELDQSSDKLPRVFFEDARLSSFWMGLGQGERDQMFSHLSNVIVPEVVRDSRQTTSEATIFEQEEESSSEKDQNLLQCFDDCETPDLLLDDDYSLQFRQGGRRNREERKKEANKSLTTSSAGDMTGTEILNRRSRKQRQQMRLTNSGGSQSNPDSIVTSNSDSQKIQKPSWQYEYNSNQLQNAYSINKEREEEVDPESLQPINAQFLIQQHHGQNQAYLLNWEGQDPQIDENELMTSNFKNHLFDSHSNNSQNIAFKHKQNLIALGRKSFDPPSEQQDQASRDAQNFQLSFKFIKRLSAFKSLCDVEKEAQKEVGGMMQSRMHLAFYQHLVASRQITAERDLDLVPDDDDEVQEKVVIAPMASSEQQQPQNKKKNKKKNKKNKKKQQLLNAAAAEEQKVEELPSSPPVDALKSPKSHLRKLMKLIESPKQEKLVSSEQKKVEILEYSPTSTDDSGQFLAYRQKKIEEVLNMQCHLDAQAEAVEKQLEGRVVTSDDDQNSALFPMIETHKAQEQISLTNQLSMLEDLELIMGHNNLEQQIQNVLANAQPAKAEVKSKQYCEERTGLLSNQVHYDKYAHETIEMSDDANDSSDEDSARFRVSSDSFVLGKQSTKANERLDQLQYILSKKEMTFTSSDNLLPPPPIRAIDLCSSESESEKRPPYMHRMNDWDDKPQLTMASILDTDHSHKAPVRLQPPAQIQIDIPTPTVKPLEEQSGGQAAVPDDSKRASQNSTNKKKRNKRKKKQNKNKKPEEEQKEEQQNKQVSPQKEVDFDQIEEVILTDMVEEDQTSHRSILKNSFFVEEQAQQLAAQQELKQQHKKQSLEPSSTTAVVDLQQKVAEEEDTVEVESFLNQQVARLMQDCIANAEEATSTPKVVGEKALVVEPASIPTRRTKTKAQKKKDAVKQQQQAAVKPSPKIEPQKRLDMPVSRPTRTHSKISSMSSRSLSLSDTTSVPCYTPGDIRMARQTGLRKITPYFQQEMRKNEIKIPKRGTSASSYGKDQEKHQQMMNDIEDVFTNKPAQKAKEPSLKDVNNLSLGDISDTENIETSVDKRPKVNLQQIKAGSIKESKHIEKVFDYVEPQKQQEKRKEEPKKVTPPKKQERQEEPKKVTPPPVVKEAPTIVVKLTTKQKKAQKKAEQQATQAKSIENKDFKRKEAQIVEKSPVAPPTRRENTPSQKEQPKKNNSKGALKQVEKAPLPEKKSSFQVIKPDPKAVKKEEAKQKQQKPAQPKQFESFDSMMKTIYYSGAKSDPKKKQPDNSRSPNPMAKDKPANKEKTEKVKAPVKLAQTEPEEPKKEQKEEKKQEKPQPEVKPEIKEDPVEAKPELTTSKVSRRESDAQVTSSSFSTQKNRYQGPMHVQQQYRPVQNQQSQQTTHAQPPSQYQQQQQYNKSNQMRGYGSMITEERVVYMKHSADSQQMEKKVNMFQQRQITTAATTPTTQNSSPTTQPGHISTKVVLPSATQNNVVLEPAQKIQQTNNSTQQTTSNQTFNVNMNFYTNNPQQQQIQQQSRNNFSQQHPNQAVYWYNNPQLNAQQQALQYQQQLMLYNQMMAAQQQQQQPPQQQYYQGAKASQLLVPGMGTNSLQQQQPQQQFSQNNYSSGQQSINNQSFYNQSPFMMMPGNNNTNPQYIHQQTNVPKFVAQQPQPQHPQFVVDYPLVQLVGGKGHLLLKLLKSDKGQNELAQSLNHGTEKKFHSQLGEQIRTFSHRIEKMLADAEPKRTSIFEILKDTARKTFESRKLDFEVYGSMATGLAIDTSDLDISIAGAYTRTSNPIDDRKNLVAALASLHQNLNAIDCIRTNQFISTASIPVIKLLVDFEKLDNFQKSTNQHQPQIKLMNVDISLIQQTGDEQEEDPVTVKKNQNQVCAEFVCKKIDEHPFLKPLVLILKKFVALHGYNSPFQGTLSSYSLVLMILALLQDLRNLYGTQFEQTGGPSLNENNLGKAFTLFLQVYGEQFRGSETGLDGKSQFKDGYECLCELETASGSTQMLEEMNPALVIIDPTDPKNNVGRQSFDFEKFQNFVNLTMLRMYLRFADLSLLDASLKDTQAQLNMLAKQEEHAKEVEMLEEAKRKCKSLQTERFKGLLDSILQIDSQRMDHQQQPQYEEDRELRQLQSISKFLSIATQGSSQQTQYNQGFSGPGNQSTSYSQVQQQQQYPPIQQQYQQQQMYRGYGGQNQYQNQQQFFNMQQPMPQQQYSNWQGQQQMPSVQQHFVQAAPYIHHKVTMNAEANDAAEQSKICGESSFCRGEYQQKADNDLQDTADEKDKQQ